MTVIAVDERLLLEIIEGCEGVTPGPWIRHGVRRKIGTQDYLMVGPDGSPIAAFPTGFDPSDAFRDAAHLARLDPQTVHALATELLAARKEIAGLREGLQRVVRLADEGFDYQHQRMDGGFSKLKSAPAMVEARNLLAGGNSNE
jgi:hypothetical protein